MLVTELRLLELLSTGVVLMQSGLSRSNGFPIPLTTTRAAGTIAEDFPIHHTHKTFLR